MKEGNIDHSGEGFIRRETARFAAAGLAVLIGWMAFCLTALPTAPEPADRTTPSPSRESIVLRPDPLPELAIPHPPAAPLIPIVGEERYDPIIARVSERHQVDPALVKAVIRAESAYDHKAVSNRGAVGLMQLMPNTARALGVDDAFNPERNIDGGVKYLRQLMDQFDGDVRLALAAYNAGSKKVRKYQGVPPFKQTRGYLKKVFRYYRSYKRQMAGKPANA